MKALNILLKYGRQQFMYLDEEDAQAAYVAVKGAIENYKPYRNDTQELVSFPIAKGECSLIVDR